MSHPDSERLALLALGEPVASLADCAHLRSCQACAAEIAELSTTVQIARTSAVDSEVEAPPERVWQAVVSELGLSGGQAEPVSSHQASPASTPVEHAGGEPRHGGTSQRETATETDAPRSRTRRRRSRWGWALAAAIAVVAVGGVSAVVVTLNRPVTVAAAELDAFPAHPNASGSADVIQARDGSRQIEVTIDGAAKSDSLREVWLIRNDGGALISLGLLQGNSGTFAVPDGIDLSTYDLVDVSVEPVDGNPAHSGDSIVRGKLEGV